LFFSVFQSFVVHFDQRLGFSLQTSHVGTSRVIDELMIIMKKFVLIWFNCNGQLLLLFNSIVEIMDVHKNFFCIYFPKLHTKSIAGIPMKHFLLIVSPYYINEIIWKVDPVRFDLVILILVIKLPLNNDRLLTTAKFFCPNCVCKFDCTF
jgi:hypothetical protein